MAGWWVAVPSAHTTPVILPTILLGTCCLLCCFWGRSLPWGFHLNQCTKIVTFLACLLAQTKRYVVCTVHFLKSKKSKSTYNAPTPTLLEDYSFGAEDFFGRLNSKRWWQETWKFPDANPKTWAESSPSLKPETKWSVQWTRRRGWRQRGKQASYHIIC